MARPRISDSKRRAIADDARASYGTTEGALSRVAARHDVSIRTVRNIMSEYGIGINKDARARTKNATKATVADNAARRAALASRMLTEAEHALDAIYEPCMVFNFGGKDNSYNERQIARPTIADQRNLMIIAATAVDKHKVLDQYDSDAAGAAAVDVWLKMMTGATDE